MLFPKPQNFSFLRHHFTRSFCCDVWLLCHIILSWQFKRWLLFCHLRRHIYFAIYIEPCAQVFFITHSEQEDERKLSFLHRLYLSYLSIFLSLFQSSSLSKHIALQWERTKPNTLLALACAWYVALPTCDASAFLHSVILTIAALVF